MALPANSVNLENSAPSSVPKTLLWSNCFDILLAMRNGVDIVVYQLVFKKYICIVCGALCIRRTRTFFLIFFYIYIFFCIHRSTGPIGARPQSQTAWVTPPPTYHDLMKIYWVYPYLHQQKYTIRRSTCLFNDPPISIESNRIVSYLFLIVLIHPVSVYSAHLICYLVSGNQ